MFEFLLKYVWFLFGLFILVQLIFLQTRVDKIATESGDSLEHVRNFLLVYTFFWVAPYFVFGILQILGGFDSAFYIFFAPLTSPFMLLAIAFMFVWWALIAYFIFLRNGASYLARYNLGHRMPRSPRAIKILVAAIPLLWVCVLAFGRVFFPNSPF